MNGSQGRQHYNERSSIERRYYVDGNTVRKVSPARREQVKLTRSEAAARKNRDKARYMNLGYVVFLSVAVAVTAFTLLGYVKMQSNLTISAKRVASLERELNDIRLTNDETLARINGSINLEDIKQTAVAELGMTYAKEGQVVVIESEGSDYVRQLGDLQ